MTKLCLSLCLLPSVATAHVAGGWHRDLQLGGNVWPSATNWFVESHSTNLWVRHISDITTQVVGSVTNTYTNTVLDHISTGPWMFNSTPIINDPDFGLTTNWIVYTSMYVNVKGLRALDTYFAKTEREFFGLYNARDPARFYFQDRQNLLDVKTMFEDGVDGFTRWADVTATNGAGNYSGQQYVPGFQGQPDFLASQGFPTNWHEWTPYFSLNGGSPEYGTLTTNTHTVQANTTNGAPYTNTVWDLWENEQTITGTSGHPVSIVSTNANLIDGYTTKAYTWHRVDELLDGMKWFKVNRLPYTSPTQPFGQPRWTGSNGPFSTAEWWEGSGSSTSSWAAAKTAAEASFAPVYPIGLTPEEDLLMEVATRGGYSTTPRPKWTATISTGKRSPFWPAMFFTGSAVWTNNPIEMDVDWYFYPNAALDAADGVGVYDNNGVFSDTGGLVISLTDSSLLFADGYLVSTQWFGITNIPAWCADPTLVTNTARGFRASTNDAVVKPHFLYTD